MIKETTNFIACFLLYLVRFGVSLILSEILWSPIDWGGGAHLGCELMHKAFQFGRLRGLKISW